MRILFFLCPFVLKHLQSGVIGAQGVKGTGREERSAHQGGLQEGDQAESHAARGITGSDRFSVTAQQSTSRSAGKMNKAFCV